MKEKDTHRLVAQYLHVAYPRIIFASDFAAGLKLPIWLAKRQKELRSGKSYPDMFIAEPRGAYHGLFLELKKEGTQVYKRNGAVRASKDDRLQLQHDIIVALNSKGYYASFAIGYENAKLIIDWYLQGGVGKVITSDSTITEDGTPF